MAQGCAIVKGLDLLKLGVVLCNKEAQMFDTEKAERVNAARSDQDAHRFRLEADKRTHPYSCFMCGRNCTIHRLKDEVWAQACPDYLALKAKLRELYKGTEFFEYTAYLLCFRCVEARLGRPLTRADFGNAHIHEDLFYLGEIVNRKVPNGTT